MEEDLYYNQVMTAPARRLSQPPAYEESPEDHEPGHRRESNGRRGTDGIASSIVVIPDDFTHDARSEFLPNYQSSLNVEGVFMKKHEIENTTRRAEDRHWHTVFVALNGTALNVYNVKKDWGWGRSRDGPSICPDNPPWVKKAKLEKSYSLLHADAGIAADYSK